MRKTQVALAALALVASTAALADVKVYGNVDAGVLSTGGTTAFFGGGNNATTLMGFRGSEDLGGGLKAGFNLETGLSLASGSYQSATSGGNKSLFNRAANVSLSNESVGITLGNQISIVVLDALVNGATGVGGDLANVPGVVRVLGGQPGAVTQTDGTAATNGNFGNAAQSGFFIPQAVTLSANGGGITVKGQYRVVDKTDTNSSYQAVTASTSLAGVNVAAGYQSGGFATTSYNYTSTFIAANTSFGDVRVNGAFSSNTGSAKSNGYLVGASMPVVGALAAGVTYASGTSALGTQLTFALNYGLSKSTSAYLGYSQFSKNSLGGGFANESGSITTAGKNLTAVGLTHSF